MLVPFLKENRLVPAEPADLVTQPRTSGSDAYATLPKFNNYSIPVTECGSQVLLPHPALVTALPFAQDGNLRLQDSHLLAP